MTYFKLSFPTLVILLLFVDVTIHAQTAKSLYEEALQHYEQDDFEQAISIFDQVIEMDQSYFNAYLKKSYALYYLNQYEKALETMERGFLLIPKDYSYFFMKAQFYDKLKKYDLALKYLDIALMFDPSRLTYYNFRADLNMELGNYKAAVKDYDYILSINPEKYDLYFKRGLAEFNQKNRLAACLDWAYAREKSENCKMYFFYKCTDLDLRPYDYKRLDPMDVELPQFDNYGNSDLDFFFLSRLKYPADAIDDMKQGTIFVRFSIDSQGDVKDIRPVNSLSPKLDSAAIDVILQTRGHWKPAVKSGINVDFSFILPVRFTLEDQVYSERNLFDSILQCQKLNDTEREQEFLREYVVQNPHNIEMVQRWNSLSRTGAQSKGDEKAMCIADYIDGKSVFLKEVSTPFQYYKYYLDKKFTVTEPSKAKYIMITTDAYTTKAFVRILRIYTTKGEKILKGGLYNGNPDGKFTLYYPNGINKMTFTVYNGKLIKNVDYFTPDNQMYQRIAIVDDQFYVTHYADTTNNSSFRLEEFLWKYKENCGGPNDTIEISGVLQDGFRHGEWKVMKNHVLVFEEEYKKDNFKKGIMYSNDQITEYNTQKLNAKYLMPYCIEALHKSPESDSANKQKPKSLFYYIED